MADVFIVLAHIGRGKVASAYSTLALAQACIGPNPGNGYEIVQVTIDGENVTFPQRGSSNVSGPGAYPVRTGITNGRTQVH